MQPDDAVARLQLAVDDLPSWVTGELPGAEAEDASQVLVGGLEIRVDEDRDAALNGRVEHGHFLQYL